MVTGKMPALRWSVPNDQPVDWVSPSPSAIDQAIDGARWGA